MMKLFFGAARLEVDESVHTIRAEDLARHGGTEETYSRRVRESVDTPKIRELAEQLDDRFQLTYQTHPAEDPYDTVSISVVTDTGEVQMGEYAAPVMSWPGRTWKKALKKALDLQEELQSQGRL